MKNDEFWSVELGARMGPLVLGTEYEQLLQVMRDRGIDVDRLRLDGSGILSVPEIDTQFKFSETFPKTLVRIDVQDARLRFGPLAVIGKRVHEIIGMFKVSRKQTLWCSVESNAESGGNDAGGNTNEQSRRLLASGTIWIPGLGLGLTLLDGLVAIVHLCNPADAPRSGTGIWTKEQQMLSEVREIPEASLAASSRKGNRSRKLILSAMLHLGLVAAILILILWAMQLQRRWDAATEVPAVVVAMDPSPPHPLPNDITVSFNDSSSVERRQVLGYRQFEASPKLGDEINVRYLPDAPDNVLGPVAARDIGFESALPCGIGILAIYSVLHLILLGAPRRRRS